VSEFSMAKGTSHSRRSDVMLAASDYRCREPEPEQLARLEHLCELTGTTIAPGKTWTAAELTAFLGALRRKMAKW
jgi:hypothetical protein